MLKVFRTSLFPNPVMYLVHAWYDDRCWYKILLSTIPNSLHEEVTDIIFLLKVTDIIFLLKVKDIIFMLKFYIKVFRTSLFPNPVMYLVHVWYDDRYLILDQSFTQYHPHLYMTLTIFYLVDYAILINWTSPFFNWCKNIFI